jgi:hypothetical protein
MHTNRAATGAPARRPAGLLLAALAAAPATAADVTTPMISGLPWRSGATGASPCLAALRGRALDANNTFLGHIRARPGGC